MEKILIVDDSLVQAAQLKSILESDYDVTVAQTAEDGLRLAGGEDFSLILLDVVMPGMDGFTLLKKLQEEIVTQSIPVILITSLSDEPANSAGCFWELWTISQSPSIPSLFRRGSIRILSCTNTVCNLSGGP